MSQCQTNFPLTIYNNIGTMQKMLEGENKLVWIYVAQRVCFSVLCFCCLYMHREVGHFGHRNNPHQQQSCSSEWMRLPAVSFSNPECLRDLAPTQDNTDQKKLLISKFSQQLFFRGFFFPSHFPKCTEDAERLCYMA